MTFSQQNPHYDTLWHPQSFSVLLNERNCHYKGHRRVWNAHISYFRLNIWHSFDTNHWKISVEITLLLLRYMRTYYNVVFYVLCCLLFIIIVSKWQFTIPVEVLYLQDLPSVCWGDRSSIHLTSEEPAFGLQDLSQWVAFHPWVSHHCSGDSDYV